MPEMPNGDHPIGDLVHQLLTAVQAVAHEADSPVDGISPVSSRPAEFCYELDTVISQYLEHNELSASEYEHIQQQVINTLAHHLHHGLQAVDAADSGLQGDHPDSSDLAASLNFDHHGNAEMADVLHLLDHHFSADPPVAAQDHGLADTGGFGLSFGGHG
ncbi:MAG: hypothetical protein ACKO0M_14135 [Cyanobium sp.]